MIKQTEKFILSTVKVMTKCNTKQLEKPLLPLFDNKYNHQTYKHAHSPPWCLCLLVCFSDYKMCSYIKPSSNPYSNNSFSTTTYFSVDMRQFASEWLFGSTSCSTCKLQQNELSVLTWNYTHTVSVQNNVPTSCINNWKCWILQLDFVYKFVSSCYTFLGCLKVILKFVHVASA